MAGRTPGAPPISTPRPPLWRSRKWAPICGASRPATSLIGASSGSAPLAQLHRLVGQRCRLRGEQRLGHVRVGGEVEVREQRQVLAQELELLGLRLLDLDDHLLRPGVGGASARSSPRRRRSRSSLIDAPAPAPVSTKTLIPLRSSSRTPSGVIATRCSAVLTSLGTPTVLIAAPESVMARALRPRWPWRRSRRRSCYNTAHEGVLQLRQRQAGRGGRRADPRRRQPGDRREVRHRPAVRDRPTSTRRWPPPRTRSRRGATRRRRNARSPCSASPMPSRPAPTS